MVKASTTKEKSYRAVLYFQLYDVEEEESLAAASKLTFPNGPPKMKEFLDTIFASLPKILKVPSVDALVTYYQAKDGSVKPLDLAALEERELHGEYHGSGLTTKTPILVAIDGLEEAGEEDEEEDNLEVSGKRVRKANVLASPPKPQVAKKDLPSKASKKETEEEKVERLAAKEKAKEEKEAKAAEKAAKASVKVAKAPAAVATHKKSTRSKGPASPVKVPAGVQGSKELQLLSQFAEKTIKLVDTMKFRMEEGEKECEQAKDEVLAKRKRSKETASSSKKAPKNAEAPVAKASSPKKKSHAASSSKGISADDRASKRFEALLHADQEEEEEEEENLDEPEEEEGEEEEEEHEEQEHEEEAQQPKRKRIAIQIEDDEEEDEERPVHHSRSSPNIGDDGEEEQENNEGEQDASSDFRKGSFLNSSRSKGPIERSGAKKSGSGVGGKNKRVEKIPVDEDEEDGEEDDEDDDIEFQVQGLLASQIWNSPQDRGLKGLSKAKNRTANEELFSETFLSNLSPVGRGVSKKIQPGKGKGRLEDSSNGLIGASALGGSSRKVDTKKKPAASAAKKKGKGPAKKSTEVVGTDGSITEDEEEDMQVALALSLSLGSRQGEERTKSTVSISNAGTSSASGAGAITTTVIEEEEEEDIYPGIEIGLPKNTVKPIEVLDKEFVAFNSDELEEELDIQEASGGGEEEEGFRAVEGVIDLDQDGEEEEETPKWRPLIEREFQIPNQEEVEEGVEGLEEASNNLQDVEGLGEREAHPFAIKRNNAEFEDHNATLYGTD